MNPWCTGPGVAGPGLVTGFSRTGVAMVTGWAQGLPHRHTAPFSLLLAPPMILAADAARLWLSLR